VESVAFSVDGRWLAAANGTAALLLWEADTPALACALAHRNLSCEEWQNEVGDDTYPYRRLCPALAAPRCKPALP
jgi:hypothetical protein